MSRANSKTYTFRKWRFALLVLLARLLVALVFSMGGIGSKVTFFLSFIGSGAIAAVIEGQRKGSLDKLVTNPFEWPHIKRGMWSATAALDGIIAAVFCILLVAAGEPHLIIELLEAPLFIGSVILCYAAFLTIIPLCYFSWAQKAAAPIGFK